MMKLLSIALATAAFTVDAGNKNKVIHSNNKHLDDKNAEEVAFWTRSLKSLFPLTVSGIIDLCSVSVTIIYLLCCLWFVLGRRRRGGW